MCSGQKQRKTAANIDIKGHVNISKTFIHLSSLECLKDFITQKLGGIMSVKCLQDVGGFLKLLTTADLWNLV